MEFKSTIKGVPCIVRITKILGPGDCEFEILDVNGNPAPDELMAEVTDADLEHINAQIDVLMLYEMHDITVVHEEGDDSIAASSAKNSAGKQVAVAGRRSIAAATRDRSAAITSDGSERSVAVTTGTHCGAWACSPRSVAVTTGDRSTAIASGQSSVAVAIENSIAQAVADGPDISCVAVSVNGYAMADEGGIIVLVRTGTNGVHVRVGVAGRDIEPMALYTLSETGEIVELDEDVAEDLLLNYRPGGQGVQHDG